MAVQRLFEMKNPVGGEKEQRSSSEIITAETKLSTQCHSLLSRSVTNRLLGLSSKNPLMSL